MAGILTDEGPCRDSMKAPAGLTTRDSLSAAVPAEVTRDAKRPPLLTSSGGTMHHGGCDNRCRRLGDEEPREDADNLGCCNGYDALRESVATVAVRIVLAILLEQTASLQTPETAHQHVRDTARVMPDVVHLTAGEGFVVVDKAATSDAAGDRSEAMTTDGEARDVGSRALSVVSFGSTS